MFHAKPPKCKLNHIFTENGKSLCKRVYISPNNRNSQLTFSIHRSGKNNIIPPNKQYDCLACFKTYNEAAIQDTVEILDNIVNGKLNFVSIEMECPHCGQTMLYEVRRSMIHKDGTFHKTCSNIECRKTFGVVMPVRTY
ncbi:hypothetical protein M0R19_06245 [Candidatus Pacearchaeota archaeon]|jgi:DNA-directed RNA polymerase subunit RPC12/RpoP|nr:hypothetical protein [Candidatus Pacearchaeota archaeon]